MAIVTRQSTGDRVEGDAAATLLAEHGILYEHWDVSKLTDATAVDEETPEDHILRVFDEEISRLKAEKGYHSADVIALTPETPNLDAVLAKFDKEHFHTEDEVRFVVDGRGVFAIRGQDGDMYDVEVHPGDLLAVPEGTQHYFTLCEDRTIQCIRLFTDKTGWVAHYVEAAS